MGVNTLHNIIKRDLQDAPFIFATQYTDYGASWSARCKVLFSHTSIVIGHDRSFQRSCSVLTAHLGRAR